MPENQLDNPQRTRFLVVAGIFAVLLIIVLALAITQNEDGIPSSREIAATETARYGSPIFLTGTAVAVVNEQAFDAPQGSGGGGGGGPAPSPQALPETGGGGDSGGGFVNVSQSLQERIVIKNADMSIVVEDAEAFAAQITELVEGMGGWVVSSNIITAAKSASEAEQASTRGTIQVRVPAERLEETVEQVKALALLVRSESIFGDDVTNQYVDLQSQLRNLESAEAQLVEIMDTADSTEGVVQVFNQLTSIRNDIERIRGQLQFFDESAAFSSLRVEMAPPEVERTPTPTPTFTPEPAWRPGDTFDDAVDGAVDTVQGGVDVVIWVIVFGVLALVVIGIPAAVAFTIWRRNRRGQG